MLINKPYGEDLGAYIYNTSAHAFLVKASQNVSLRTLDLRLLLN